MKVYRKLAKKNVSIDDQKDFLAAGGEGSIYLVDKFCYKITNHPFVESKLIELMELKRDNVVVPIDFLLDNKNNMVGYVLNYIDGDALCRLFNTSFWNDNKLDVNSISGIIEKFIETTQYIHDSKCLVVDWNEMNFLVDRKFEVPYFIDTNAWKTKSFPPDAITPLFRDHSSKDFSALSDWYGVGILACKLYVGIHPYKGSHPNYGKKIDDTLKRMIDNVSIFNKKAKLPAAARSFDNIPDNYMKWFIDIFEKGKRIPPPNVVGYVTVSKKKIESVFKYFKTDLHKLFQYNVKRYYVINGKEVVFGENEIIIDDKVAPLKNKKVKVGVIVSQRDMVPYFVFISNEKFHIYDDNGNLVDVAVFAKDFLVHDHMIYALHRGTIFQLSCSDIGGKQVFTFGDRYDVMPNSTKSMGSCFYMSVMGNTHFLLPSKTGSKYFLRNIRVKELDGYKIIEAKHDNNVLGIIGEKDGKYDRFMLILDLIDGKYIINTENDIDAPFLNFVVLDNGIGVSMDEDGLVTIFTTKIDKYQTKTIKDDSITSTLRLFKSGTKVLFADGKKVFSFKVAKND